MGYSHTFSLNIFDPGWPEAFGRLALDARRIVDHLAPRPALTGYDFSGTGRWWGGKRGRALAVTEGGVALNGSGDNFHDSFIIEPDPLAWAREAPEHAYASYLLDRCGHDGHFTGYCKTARKPYDLVVTAILLRAAQVAPGHVAVTSDGRWDLEWLHGARCWGDGERKGRGARQVLAELFGEPDEDSSPLGEPAWARAVADRG